jgi:hypothetical protein
VEPQWHEARHSQKGRKKDRRCLFIMPNHAPQNPNQSNTTAQGIYMM